MSRSRLHWLFGACLAGCAAGLPPVTQLQAERAAQRWPGTSLADLEQGRTLYQGRCGNCHQLFPPSHLPEQRWRTEITAMRERARLTAEQQDLIFQYLVTAGAAGTTPQSHASAPALGKQVVSE